MPASLGNLPPEILSQIIGNIGKSGWLLDVALCCRSIHDLTLPHLYSHIKLVYHCYETPFPYLKSFTTRILKNSPLAVHVRRFTLNERWGTDHSPGESSDSNSVDDIIREAIDKLCHSEEEKNAWMKALEGQANEDACIALLLPSLPNLECLDLMVPALRAEYYERMIQRVARKERPFDVQPAFSSLKVIADNCDDTKYGTSPDMMSYYLQLPSLAGFYGQRIGSSDDSTHAGLASIKPASISLTHLEIRQCKFNTADLTNILRACKGLKTFVYNLGWGHISYCEYSTSELRTALAWAEHSLENLWLDYEPGPSYWSMDNLEPIDSLTSFKVLKNIKVGMYIFFSAEADLDDPGLDNTEAEVDHSNLINLANILPSSLETIYFSHTNGRIRVLTNALKNWLQQKESSTPKLKRIAFEAFITGNENKFDFSSLDSLAQEADVTIDKIDGTALSADNGLGWEYTPGINDRGQGMDGSISWAAEEVTGSEYGVPVYVNAGNL
ncbi:hypothetical protein MMC28_006870 [Mycoblastus sanguinarius]|nr:hypothetical protein [Mycoblastus sanguinarius]